MVVLVVVVVPVDIAFVGFPWLANILIIFSNTKFEHVDIF